METKTIDVQATHPSLGDLLSLVATGTEIVLTENDMPLAKLISLRLQPPLKPRIPGLHPGAMQISEDFCAPLPDEFLLGKD